VRRRVFTTGQAWPQITGNGSKFEDDFTPGPVVRVADSEKVGILQIQDKPSASHDQRLAQSSCSEATRSPASLWDTRAHPRWRRIELVSPTVNIENIWPWVSDHDLGTAERTQTDAYDGRCMQVLSCTDKLVLGRACRTGPHYTWETYGDEDEEDDNEIVGNL
jgi:hypothetical protein